jgi:hypothetical protein
MLSFGRVRLGLRRHSVRTAPAAGAERRARRSPITASSELRTRSEANEANSVSSSSGSSGCVKETKVQVSQADADLVAVDPTLGLLAVEGANSIHMIHSPAPFPQFPTFVVYITHIIRSYGRGDAGLLASRTRGPVTVPLGATFQAPSRQNAGFFEGSLLLVESRPSAPLEPRVTSDTRETQRNSSALHLKYFLKSRSGQFPGTSGRSEGRDPALWLLSPSGVLCS